MAPSPCLPTGQAETLPPLPKLKRLSTFRKKIPSQGTNQARNERCVPCVDTQSPVSGQMAPDLSTGVHGTTPSLTVPHANHAEQVMHTKASYMQQRILPVRSPSGYVTDHTSSQRASPSTQQEKQPTLTVHHRNPAEQAMHTKASYGQQRIPPVGSQDYLNFTEYYSPSGYATNHLSPQHTLPSRQQEKQQRFDSSHNVSSQHNEWRRQMQLQHSRVPHPHHRNAHHSNGHDYRSSLHIHHYSQHFGNAGQQAHEAGRGESHQSRLPHQMHQFSRQGMQHVPQDAMQMYRQNGPGLQYRCQNQVKREENDRQYQSQMQVYKQQNQGQNQINRMQQYYMQMYQQNGQNQYGPDLQYNGRHQVQMGEKNQMSQTENHTMIMKAYRKRSQYRDWLTQFSHSKTQQVHRTEEELPQQTNQQLHNHQGVVGSSEQHWQAIRRLLHCKNQEKANESCPRGNANGAGSPKNDITPQDENIPPNHLNANPQSQMDPPPGKTDENHTQHHPQTSPDIASTPSSASENLEHTTMVGGHTLISTETFLSYLKTSAAEEDNGGNTRPPASAPHSSSRVNTKTGASVRFIDLLEDDECNDGEDAIVSPRSSSSGTDHEKEVDYCDESENIAQLGSSSPVYKQVDRNSDSENSFTDNMQREMDREIHTDVTEPDGSFRPSNMLKPSESIPTLVGCEYYTDPTTPEYREIVTEKCKHPENNVLIRPSSPVYNQGKDNAVDIQTENTQREIIEETHTSSNYLLESALTVNDCVTPANNPATRENNEKQIGKYYEFENNITLYSSSLVHKQADRNLHINYNLNDNSQRKKDEGTQSPNTSSGNVEIGIPQCVSFPSAEAPPQFDSFQNASMLDACVNDRLTPPDSDPPTPENHEQETDKCRDTEYALSRSFSHVYKRSGENTHFENNVSENTQTELSEKAPTSPKFLSDNSELGLARGVSPHSVDATIQSGKFRTKKPPRFIVRPAPPKRDPETSGNGKYSIGYKSRAKNHCKTPGISTPPAGDCTSSVGALTPTPEVNTLVNILTPSTPEANYVNDSTLQGAVSTPPAIAVQLNVPQYIPALTPLTDTYVTTAYTPPSPCIPAQPTEVSITSVDANKPPIQASEPYSQVQDLPENLNNGPANNPSPSQVVHKMPELVPIRRVRRKKRVPEGPSPEDFAGIRNSPEEKEKTQSYHSEVYAVGVRRMDTSHHEQISQRIDFTARIQEGSDASDRQSIGSIDDCSVIEQLTPSSPDKTELENGYHIRTLDMNLAEDERTIRCTAPSAESEPSHHQQIMQRNYSTNAQDAPDTSGRQEINTSYHMNSLQYSFPSNSFHIPPNAIQKNNVVTDCLMQAFNVSDSTTSTLQQHEPETSHLKQQMVNSVTMFMNADLFPNAGERPKLETKVQCLTCYETVEGEDACHHMFFGQLKCDKCDEVIASCKDLQRTLSSVEMCKKNSGKPHRYTEWNIPPIDFLCYRLRKTEKDGSFLSTLEAMEKYLEILSPLKNTKLWKSALKKCQAFTTMMLASSRQEGDRKKRQKKQNTTEKKQKTK